MTIRSALRSTALATLLLVATFTSPARALTPAAVTAVATQLGHSLPIGWGAAQDQAVAAAIAARTAAATADPEANATVHRYDVTALAGVTATDAAGDPRGGALAAFTDALADLRHAQLAPDADGAVAPVAALAIAACDLADPFAVTAPDADEVAGARAAFEDTWDGAAVDAAPAADADPIALATASAALRGDVEAAAALGDDGALAQLRTGRLAAALATAQAAAAGVWSTASAPLPEGAQARGVALWPNPAVGAVRLGFALPAAAEARVTIVDVSGRRVVERALGARTAGEQSTVLDAATVRALPAGTYFVRLTAGRATLEGRMVRLEQR